MTMKTKLVISSDSHLVIKKEYLLASRRNSSNGTKEERSKREARAERILDAASELVLRWGYKKTTIDDIAKQAGVAKGTIYLHWKTREELFLALLTREYISIAEK